MGLVEEARHNTEIPATATQRPEEFRVLRRTGGYQAPIRQHNIGLEQVVNGQAVLAREIAVASAEREARNAGR